MTPILQMKKQMKMSLVVTELISGRDKMKLQLSLAFSQSQAKGKMLEAFKTLLRLGKTKDQQGYLEGQGVQETSWGGWGSKFWGDLEIGAPKYGGNKRLAPTFPYCSCCMNDHGNTYEIGVLCVFTPLLALWLQSGGQRVWSGGPFWALIPRSFLFVLFPTSSQPASEVDFISLMSLHSSLFPDRFSWL